MCNACGGKCCKAFRIEVFSTDDVDWSLLYTREGRYWMKKKEDKLTCVALSDDGKCSIYEKRPATCRRFEVGEPRCLKLQKNSENILENS